MLQNNRRIVSAFFVFSDVIVVLVEFQVVFSYSFLKIYDELSSKQLSKNQKQLSSFTRQVESIHEADSSSTILSQSWVVFVIPTMPPNDRIMCIWWSPFHGMFHLRERSPFTLQHREWGRKTC